MSSRPTARSIPPLHCLLAFEGVARNGSLAKAAGELGVSVSAVTQSVATLEDRLRLQLVRRLSPSVVLTDAGQRYLASVQPFTSRLRDGLHDQFAVGRTQVRITAPQALGRLWLAPRLGDFARAHPRIDLVLTVTEQFHSLAEGGVDVALRYDPTPTSGEVVVPLWTDRLLAVAAPRLAQQVQDESPWSVARTAARIDHPASSWDRWLAAVGDGRGTATLPPPVLHCTDLHLAIEAAVLGLGVVIVPARLVDGRLGDGRLRQVTSHTVAARPYAAVMSPQQAARAPVQSLVDWLSAQAPAATPGAAARHRAA